MIKLERNVALRERKNKNLKLFGTFYFLRKLILKIEKDIFNNI